MISKGEDKKRLVKPLYGLCGSYTLAEGISLPYFLSLMDIDRAIDELRIVEQVPPSIDTKWSLKELFQREIDEDRVRQDIVMGYLLDPKKLKFFNAITIVLMPKHSDGSILDKFEESDIVAESPPIPWDGSDTEDRQWAQDGVQTVDFGGVQFSSFGISARLRWDENFVLAVAVDGQHRLWALRTFREDEKFRGGTLRKVEQQTKIPVLFVLLDQKAGYQNSQDINDNSIRGIARELFTDLNKNAKTVDRARELILDDKSINAQCVRTLLTEKTTQDSDELIPLSLVRWQDDSNRFDTSYYINSLVHLDLLISELLDINSPRDPMDKREVSSFIKSINLALGINGQEVTFEGRSLSKYYEEDCCDEEGEPSTPFARLPEQYLISATSGFKENFRSWLLKLLLGLKPYRELLIYARENNLIEGTFGGFQAQTKKHKVTILQQEIARDSDWNSREILSHEKNIAKSKEEQWCFKAIFQKALVRLGKIVEFKYKGDDNLGGINDVVSFLDRLYEEGVLRVDASLEEHPFRLWTFIALNPGNEKIKVARTVEDKIFYLLCVWYYGTKKLEVDAKNNIFHSSPRKLLNYFSADKNTAQWPECKRAFDMLYKAFDTPNFYGPTDQLPEKQKDDMVRGRLTAVFVAGLPKFPKNSANNFSVSEISTDDSSDKNTDLE
jgi:hypothetical protein